MNRIKEVREAKGLTQDELAEKLGTSRGQVYQLEKGLRRLTNLWLQRLAKALDCEVVELLESPTRKVPMIGIIQRGGVVLQTTRDKASSFADLPPGVPFSADLVALEVDEDKPEMGLFRNWRIYYRESSRVECSDLNSRLPYVVQIANGPVEVKLIRRGYTPGKYNLHSQTGSDIIEDAHIAWCSPVLAIIPR